MVVAGEDVVDAVPEKGVDHGQGIGLTEIGCLFRSVLARPSAEREIQLVGGLIVVPILPEDADRRSRGSSILTR